MLVIITEDDPQGGVDHVDAHRSILMMAGPYVKKGYVSHTHANFGSVLKTIYNILNVPYVNQFDVTASLLTGFFYSSHLIIHLIRWNCMIQGFLMLKKQ